MLAHYLSQAGASDVNVEARLEREPFDYREILRQKALRQARESNLDVRSTRDIPWPPKD
jgi:hypothetical protein